MGIWTYDKVAFHALQQITWLCIGGADQALHYVNCKKTGHKKEKL